MRRIAIALLLLALAPVPAFAFDTPIDLLKALYAPYSDPNFDWNKFDEAALRSKALNALFDADAKEAGDGVGRLDFDPYIDGQDYQIAKLKFGTPAITGDTATVEVTFDNFEDHEDMLFVLVKEADGWKIDDVTSKGADPYSLKEIMTEPMPTDDEGDDESSDGGDDSSD